MSKTLILHIGHYKTGTTALQVFFSGHRRFLANQGIEYPGIWFHNAKHSAFAFSILAAAGVTGRLMHDFTDPTPPRQMWGDLFRHIDEKGHKTTLISSEEFMRLGQFPAAADILARVLADRPADLNLRAVVYLRDPAAHLRSWYNQLVKMSFPVADLGTALTGDIEDIHFDYRRALAPWIDILGAENVMIRPYRNERDDPAALHRDFFNTLGIKLPENLVRAETDPNPRLDDRVIELVRLMQNMDFPRATINAVRSQALSYLDTQDGKAPGGDTTLDHIREQSRAGLAWLGTLPGSSVPVAEFENHLPQADSPENINRSLLLGFVFAELIQLRQRVNNANLSDLAARIDALEARMPPPEKQS